jgi:hypothetical protein
LGVHPFGKLVLQAGVLVLGMAGNSPIPMGSEMLMVLVVKMLMGGRKVRSKKRVRSKDIPKVYRRVYPMEYSKRMAMLKSRVHPLE